MLEEKGLLVLPWSPPDSFDVSDAADFTWVRPILALDTKLPLGFAGCSPSSSRWRKWWHGQVIEVREGLDASELMTIRRPVGLMRMWQIFDAEERRLGSCYRHKLLDGVGELFGRLHDNAGGIRKFVNQSGVQLGAWEKLTGGVHRLRFAEPFNPFARMNLLAHSLTLSPLPRE